MTHKSISDETLNAYVDDELELEEKRRIFKLLCEDKALGREAHELVHLRSLIQHAYRRPPLPPGRKGPRRRVIYFPGLAASLIVVGLGSLVGWCCHEALAESLVSVSNPAASTQSHHVGNDGQGVAQATNVILYIDRADPVKLRAVLDKTEQLVQRQRHDGREFHLEIFTNKGGIELLLKGRSPYPQRIAALMKKYNNVTFMACSNALRHLEEQGVKFEFLPGVKTDHTAMDIITQRVEQNWAYLKI